MRLVSLHFVHLRAPLVPENSGRRLMRVATLAPVFWCRRARGWRTTVHSDNQRRSTRVARRSTLPSSYS